MKKSILLLVAVFLSLLSMATAQTNESQQRQRDIKIAEGILAEIFDSRSSQNTVFPGFHGKTVRGEYIPGYGVHFTISSGFSNFVHLRSLNSEDDEVRVEVQSNGTSTSDSGNEDEIKGKILEYMTKYASLISGLSDDETIRVTYAPNNSGSMTWIFVSDGERNEVKQLGLSAWAEVSDLKRYRNGSISEQQLRDRINTHVLNGEETYRDFNIFASVLETALNDADTEHLRVSGKPQMEYLPGLGVRYRVQVSARPSVILNEIQMFDGGGFEIRLDSLRMNLDESLKMVEKSLAPLVIKLDSMREIDELSKEERERFQEELQEQKQEIQAHQNALRKANSPSVYGFRSATDDSLDLSGEADAVIDELLSVIENYGSTLTSLNDDEMLMISVSWSGRSDDLPERTEVRIKKSDLLRGEDPDIEEIERR